MSSRTLLKHPVLPLRSASEATDSPGKDSSLRTSPPINVRQLALGCAMLLMASFTYLFRLGSKSLWSDEVLSLHLARMPLSGVVTAWDYQPPLYYGLLHFWVKAFGGSEVALRLPSVAFGLAAVLMVGWILRGDKRPLLAPLVMGMMALSPMTIEWAQTARVYSLLLAMTVASFAFLLMWEERRSRGRAAGYAFIALAMCYTHHFGVMTFLLQQVYVWTRIREGRLQPKDARLGAYVLAGYLPCLPIVWIHLQDVRTHGHWLFDLGRPGLSQVAETFSFFVMWGMPQVLVVIYLAFAIVGVRSMWADSAPGQPLPANESMPLNPFQVPPPTLRIVLFWLAPIAVTFLASWLLAPLLLHRYLIGSVPAFCILVCAGVLALPQAWGRALAVILLTAIPLASLRRKGGFVLEDWRSLAHEIQSRESSNDVLLISPMYLTRPLRYYYRGSLTFRELPYDSEERLKELEDSVRDAAARSGRIWHVNREPPPGRWSAVADVHKRFSCASVQELDFGSDIKLYLEDFTSCRQ